VLNLLGLSVSVPRYRTSATGAGVEQSRRKTRRLVDGANRCTLPSQNPQRLSRLVIEKTAIPVHPQVVGVKERPVRAPGLPRRALAVVGRVPSPGVPRSNRQLGNAPLQFFLWLGAQTFLSAGVSEPGTKRTRMPALRAGVKIAARLHVSIALPAATPRLPPPLAVAE
jgi:hypothetical protein